VFVLNGVIKIQIQMFSHYCSTDAGMQQNWDEVTKHNSSRQKLKNTL